MQRYFLSKDHFSGENIYITGEDAKHIRRVMRMEVGYKIVCCDDAGNCFLSEIVDFPQENVKAKILHSEEKQVELPIHVTVAHGLPKADKFELVIQKGTELGATSFVPFEAERSVVKWDRKKAVKKVERWNKIAKEGAEQSHRHVVPEVNDVSSFNQLLDRFDAFDFVLVAYEEAAKSDEKSRFYSILSKMKAGEKLLLIVGPEGGFSDREIEKMDERGATICGFGPRILRSETAPLYGLAAISYHFELLG
ncbi:MULTISPECIES: 16S rRNA (uracil(1498)-N(3))-methyltransferase [Bacillaceae]|uniref:Ribosomal RNA small subunit methyltransferase E n=1 Tax=Evansella alkalicola TaxID=745819 RepID=A0ABS6JWA8_9BACI|nr:MULTISPECIES: 16S rRNA (uracil(1498)-N(3))-methyltransferase [Bacillaceae]MBU9722512.1 16S rRNA (uracil(1498)-N(3))-methyltransferase [Bacillus alkalicola]